MESTYTRVADGVRTLWTKSGGRVVAHFSSVSIVTDKIGALLVSAAPIEKVKAEAEPEADPSRPALSDQEMETLMQQTHDAAHPLMPHAPVLVGAASCEDVVLRWRTVETDGAWPIHGYVVQRFPDSTHKLEWETLIESLNASESTDTNVRISQQYLYRVQAISGAARSPFAYHAVSMNQTSCYPNQSLRAYLPTALHVIPFIDLLSIEAVQTFVLIISCFLAVFGVMRSNVKKVQHTRSRQGRLRKMEKLISEESRLYPLPRLSSSETSSTTEPSTSVNELSSRSSQYEPFGPTNSLNPTKVARPTSDFQRSESPQRPASFSAPLDKSVCQYCHKKFGIFRRRRVCDVCEVVTLCRKCGVQAPSNVTVDGLRESLGGRNSVDTTAHPRVTKASSVRSRRPKTICRDCHEHAERFSRAPTHPLR